MNQKHDSKLFKNTLERILFSKPKMVLVILFVVFCFFIGFAVKVKKDNSFRNILPPNDTALMMHDYLFDEYDINDKILIAIVSPVSVYNKSTLNKIFNITEELQSIPDIEDIKSIYTVENISGRNDSLIIKSLANAPPQSPEEINRLREKIMNNHLLWNVLVSGDEKTTVLLLQPVYDISNSSKAVRVNDHIRQILKKYEGPEKLYFSGFPVTVPTVSYLMSKDMRTLLRRVVVLTALILFLCFRSKREVFLPVSEVLLCTVIVFGLMYLFDQKLTIISTSIPVLLIAIGVADDIYFLHVFSRNYTYSKLNAVLKTFRELSLPIFLTSLTTIIGFLSLALTDIVALKTVGIFTAIGVALTFIYSIIFVPNILLILKIKAKNPSISLNSKSKYSNFRKKLFKPFRVIFTFLELDKIYQYFNMRSMIKLFQHLALQRSKYILLFTGIIFLTGNFLSTKIPVRHSAVEFFKEKSEIRMHDAVINQHTGGTATLNILLSGNESMAKDPFVLKKVRQFQNEIESIPEVGYSISITDFLERMNYAIHNNDINFQKIPDNTEQISQYILLYETSGGNELSKYANYDYSELNISFQIKKNDTRTFSNIIKQIDSAYIKIFENTLTLKKAGFVMINLSTVAKIVKAQLVTVVTVFILMFLILLIVYKSFRTALAGLVPVAFSLSIIPIVMYRHNIPLNLSTSIIGGIAIGICVDYCIHFISYYLLKLQEYKDNDIAIYETIQNTAKPILVNSIAVGVGFSTLVSSSFTPIVYLGVLLFVSMIASGFGSIVILGALFHYIPARKLV